MTIKHTITHTPTLRRVSTGVHPESRSVRKHREMLPPPNTIHARIPIPDDPQQRNIHRRVGAALKGGVGVALLQLIELADTLPVEIEFGESILRIDRVPRDADSMASGGRTDGR